MPSFEAMTSLQFYQWGMKNPSAMGIYLSSLMNFDMMDFRHCLAAFLIISGNQPHPGSPTHQHKNCYRTGPDPSPFARVRPHLTIIRGNMCGYYIFSHT